MSKSVDIIKRQILRDEILEILMQAGSAGASIRVILLALRQIGECIDNKELDKELYYLADKELINIKDISNKRLHIDMRVYVISAKGIDTLEGSEESVGIGE